MTAFDFEMVIQSSDTISKFLSQALLRHLHSFMTELCLHATVHLGTVCVVESKHTGWIEQDGICGEHCASGLTLTNLC